MSMKKGAMIRWNLCIPPSTVSPSQLQKEVKKMFDQNQIKTKGDMQEILAAASQRIGNVLENETSQRIYTERQEAEKNAITALLTKMETLTSLKVVVPGATGSPEELAKRRGASALRIRDLLTCLDEEAPGRDLHTGTPDFPPELVRAIYLGHRIFTAAEGERRDLAKWIPASQPASTPAAVVVKDEV